MSKEIDQIKRVIKIVLGGKEFEFDIASEEGRSNLNRAIEVIDDEDLKEKIKAEIDSYTDLMSEVLKDKEIKVIKH